MRLPLRIKLSLIMVLVLVASIGIITYLAINLFIKDKSNYIYELNSITARDRSAAISHTIGHLQEKMRIFTRTYQTQFGNIQTKTNLLQSYFDQYLEFVALSIYREDGTITHVFESQKVRALNIKIKSVEKLLKKNGLNVQDTWNNRGFFANATVDIRLPAFAIAVPIPGKTKGGKQIAVGVVDLNQIQPAKSDQGLQELFVVDNKGKIVAHPNPTLVSSQADFSKYEIVQSMFETANQVHAGTKAFKSPNGEEMLGAFALLSQSQGGVIVQVPRSLAFQGALLLIKSASFVASVILIVAVVISLFLAGSLTRPMQELAKATRRIAKGDFNLRLKAKAKDEIGDLANSFNKMGIELSDREKALEEANMKLIQSEKMAAFGQLGAGIAHEVKNPLTGILGYAQLARRKLPEDHAIHKNLGIIEKETKRCKEIIENLLKFARQEKAEFRSTDIHQVVKDSIVLVEHQLTINKVKITREISDSHLSILGNGNQLQQVLMNLMINAQHAMEPNGGQLRVSSQRVNGFAEIRIKDSGHGIPEDVKKRIFEPFFTTKPTGKGTGLGLSVTYGIIRDHKGEIVVESEVNKGTEFIIRLPVVENQVKKQENKSQGSTSVKDTQPNV